MIIFWIKFAGIKRDDFNSWPTLIQFICDFAVLSQCLGVVFRWIVFSCVMFVLAVTVDIVTYCVVRLFIEKLPKHPNYINASKDDKQKTRKVI